MERDYIYNQLQTAWAIVTTFRESIARRKTQIEMDRQEIWLQMQVIHVLTARLREFLQDEATRARIAVRSRIIGRREERELIQVILTQPCLVGEIDGLLDPQEIKNPDLRRILEVCIEIHRSGRLAMADLVRQSLDDPELAGLVLTLHSIGKTTAPHMRDAWLKEILKRFAERRASPAQQKLKRQSDIDQALEFLRKLSVSKSNVEAPNE